MSRINSCLSTQEAHALWAPTYDRTPNPLTSLEARVVMPLLPKLKAMTALDAACGTGRWLEELARRGASPVLGIDLSRAMLREAEVKPGLRGLLVEADCVAMPVRSGSVNFAISSFSVAYIPSLNGLAAEFARILMPHGELIVTDFHPSARARGWTRSFRHNRDVIEIESVDRPMPNICEAFACAGFQLVTRIEAEFQECDRGVFESGGRGDLFRKALGAIALYVCLFRRSANQGTI